MTKLSSAVDLLKTEVNNFLLILNIPHDIIMSFYYRKHTVTIYSIKNRRN
jgi:hypothetical protein